MNLFRSSIHSEAETLPAMKQKSYLLSGAFAAALMLLSGSRILAQSNGKPPTQLTYQGFLTDANGVPFGNSAPVNKTVIFRIYDSLTGGTIKWSSQQVVTVDKGYFSVLLGQGSAVGSEPFSSELTGIFSGSTASDRFLELNADGTTIAPRLRFLPAPYAMLAKSATELADPVTGVAALGISGGNLTVPGNLSAANLSGNGASLTSLNANQISSGTVPVARIPSLDASQIGSGKLATGRIPSLDADQIGSGTLAVARIPSLDAGQIGSGTLPNGRTTATSANTVNAIVARDASGNINAAQVVGDSFKIRNTTTLVLYSVSRGSLSVGSPITGVTQQNPASGNVTSSGRQSSNSGWWKSTSGLGTLLYTGTFVVPAGETWEVDYTCQYYWGTDDTGGIQWSLDDALTDDGVDTGYKLNQTAYLFNQTFILSSGTHVTRVKAIIGSGSGSDGIYFPWHTPSNLVVRKFKTN
jgi:hypothetical protein